VENAEIAGPLPFEIGWGAIAVGLILLAIGYYVVLFVSTRKLKPREDVSMLPTVAHGAERLSLIKSKYAKRIQDVQEAYNAGKISQRKAFQSLSVNLRNFTHEYSGSGAYAMTLTDLEKHQAPALLSDRIKVFYPIAFEEAEKTGDVNLAVQDALQVIQVWY
jgi:hypothetical protein